MTAAYVEDTDALGLGRPDHEPKATETIDAIVALIEALIESGHAYERGGDVYFRVASFDGYGKLSNRPLEEMQQGEGDDAAELKEAPQDFALWKARKEGEDTWWESPWGEGRPGWHIECSAMAEEVLGVRLRGPRRRLGPRLPAPRERDRPDRGGARRAARADLDAQRHGRRWATRRWPSRWATSGLLHGALEQFGRDAFLMWMVGAPLPQAGRLHRGGARGRAPRGRRVRDVVRRLGSDGRARDRTRYAERFFDALADDFNTPQARAVLFDWVAEANRRIDAGERLGPGRLGEMLHALGLEGLLEPAEEAPDEEWSACRRARRGPRGARLRARRPDPRRAAPRAGRSATRPRARGSCAAT